MVVSVKTTAAALALIAALTVTGCTASDTDEIPEQRDTIAPETDLPRTDIAPELLDQTPDLGPVLPQLPAPLADVVAGLPRADVDVLDARDRTVPEDLTGWFAVKVEPVEDRYTVLAVPADQVALATPLDPSTARVLAPVAEALGVAAGDLAGTAKVDGPFLLIELEAQDPDQDPSAPTPQAIADLAAAALAGTDLSAVIIVIDGRPEARADI